MSTISELIFVISLIKLVILICVEDFSFFNPIRNYKKWNRMNWFGVIFFTLLLTIIFPVFALGYWFYKLCTVGRNT